MNPVVSIIIPCYNASKTICTSLASLKSQTYTSWEAICIDDGSMDATKRIIQDEEKIDNRIKLYSQTNNLGVAQARETGIMHATGEYILFLDADDTLIPKALELMLNVFRNGNEIDIVVSGFNIIKEGKVWKRKMARFTYLDSISYLKRVLCGKNGWELCAKMYKRDLFDKPLYIPNLRAGEDAVVFIQLICNSQKIGGCSIPVYNYIQYEKSASHIQSLENAEDTIKAAQIIEAILIKKGILSSLIVEMGTMFLLSYSNSTRKFRLKKEHSLILNVKKHMRLKSFLKLPIYRIMYIIIIYYYGNYISKFIKR